MLSYYLHLKLNKNKQQTITEKDTLSHDKKVIDNAWFITPWNMHGSAWYVHRNKLFNTTVQVVITCLSWLCVVTLEHVPMNRAIFTHLQEFDCTLQTPAQNTFHAISSSSYFKHISVLYKIAALTNLYSDSTELV